MICASCDRAIEDDGIVCPRCNAAEPLDARPRDISHHALANTVRRLKGLVLVSLVFGPIAAPFAIVIASRALARYAGSGTRDAAIHRQLVLLHRIAIALLVGWALFLGVEIAMWRGGG